MRVIARLAEPIAYMGDLLHIDGPLAYAAFHDLDYRTRRTLPPIESADWPIDIAMPLSTWWCDQVGDISDKRLLKRSKRGTNGPPPRIWGWCGSAADDSTWGVRGAVEIRKKPDLDRMRRYTDAPSANIGAGHMKAYDLKVPTVFSREVEWWAHGDPEKVRAMLARHVIAIGKKRNIGSGTVREWVVEPCSEDRSVVAADGKLMRRMPLGAADGAPGYGGMRPPYYHVSRLAESVEPC